MGVSKSVQENEGWVEKDGGTGNGANLVRGGRGKREERRGDGIPALNKVLEVGTPQDVRLRLVLELRDGLPDDVRQQVDQTGLGLHLSPVRGEREPVLSNLEQGHAGRPDIRGDGVRLARDALGRHVVAGSDEGIRLAFGTEVAGNAKVAQLDGAIAAEENVAWFDVPVDDLLAVQVGQASQDPFGNLAEDLLAGAATQALDLLVDAVERSTLAELHGDGDGGGGRVDKSAVVSADVLRRTFLVEAELAHDLLLDIRIRVRGDDLAGGGNRLAQRMDAPV